MARFQFIRRVIYVSLLSCIAVVIALISQSVYAEDKASNVPTELQKFRLDQKWSGDFDEMKKRRLIRALVPYSKTLYFVDKGTQRGIAAELLKAFEDKINKDFNTGNLKIYVIIIPTPRDLVISRLVEGYGDIGLGNYTITEERLESVDFSDPLLEGVSELIVTGPSSPSVSSLDDLSGKEVWVRESSSYYQSLKKLNESFKNEGKEPIKIRPADEHLEDEDILEMVNAGLIDISVVDSHKGELWANIFDQIKLHPDLAVRTGGKIGWMMRKDSPGLQKVVNDFVHKNKKGTLFGNMLFKRYLRDTKWVKNSLNEEDRARFGSAVEVFRKYGGKYEFDYLLLAAQGYQESGLDQNKRSPAGAIGVMQLLPTTAKDRHVAIPNIDKLENNIHAGTKYLRFMVNEYFDDPDINQLNRMLFAFASYNAGPNKIALLRKKAEEKGLDPNKWFQNVEIAVSDEVGRETVTYVSNIYKYYVAYQMSTQEIEKRKELKSNEKK
jgi:membrane-bound lytic murein transglycosylase MltF